MAMNIASTLQHAFAKLRLQRLQFNHAASVVNFGCQQHMTL
jgi:hypothetical protein